MRLRCCDVVDVLLLYCCYIVAIPCCYVVAMLLPCCSDGDVDAMLRRWCCDVAVMSLRCCCGVDVVLVRCCCDVVAMVR